MKILIAKDEAFNFTYRANIDMLKSRGEVSFFSPLHDTILPQCDFLYLPGGYPELFAEQLSQNETMRRSIKDYAMNGGRIFAECGGFMYLTQNIDGIEMCGVFPLEATMENARLHLGYRTMEWGGMIAKGHEFHYSEIKDSIISDDVEIIQKQYTAKGTKVPTAVYKYKNVLAGYTHWYWGENEKLLDYFMSL